MDEAVRNWERAVASGDEQARLPLANAYHRLGRIEDTLRLLREAVEPDAPLQALESEVWRGLLSQLAPARRIPGARPYGELWGWAGEAAVLLESRRGGGARLLGAVDWAQGRFLYEASADRPHGPPRAAGPGELLLPGGPGVFQRLDLSTGRLVSEGLASGGSVLEFDSTCSRALLHYVEPGRRTLVSVLRISDGAEEFSCRGGAELKVVPNWEQGWIAWRERGPLEWSWLPTRESDREEPSGRIGGRRGHPTPLAVCGRFLLAREGAGALLYDPTCDERLELRELPRGTHGPWRLSRDRQALLGFRLGVPSAFAIEDAANQTLTLPGGQSLRRAAWHPSVDVVALGHRPAGAELRSLEGDVWLHLPRDAQPLGWGPQGRSLVVVRELGSLGGLLELWTPGGTL
ncbi:MAG: hypothetical protein JKY65_09970 [Planctomycetes bacterium]|nr:hypothetical protein [Planctomycetota bacterium]